MQLTKQGNNLLARCKLEQTEHSKDSIGLPRKSLAGLVYIFLALSAIAMVVVETQANYQWYTYVGNLELRISSVAIHPDNSTGFPSVAIQASVFNPASYNGLRPIQAGYAVWVNSTSETFDPGTGSTMIAQTTSSFDKPIPATGRLDLSFNVSILSAVVTPLRSFLGRHNMDQVTNVQITLYFQSTYGKFIIPYCYLLPGQVLVPVCPPVLEAVSHRPGG